MSNGQRGNTSQLPARLWPALLLLGFSSGLPQPLVDGTFSAWLSDAGYSKAQLLRFGYVTLPFSLKVLWAPLVDRFAPPVLGRRRGWILACQVALLASLLAMARMDPRTELAALLVAATLVALAAATQDLVVQGYVCDALPSDRLGAGAGLQVWGYRASWILSGGLVLAMADPESLGWSGAYAAMAALLVPGMVACLMAPEPARGAAPPATLRATVAEPLREWWRTLGARGLAVLLLFALLYRLPDMVANLLAPTFQKELFGLKLVGVSRSVLGLVGAAFGVAVAAYAMPRLGTMRALFLFGLAQAFSNLGYVGLAHGWWSGTSGLVGVLFVENACGAMAAIGFVAYLMGFCRSASSATQYALLTTVTLLGPHLVREPIAKLSKDLGWSGFFLVTTALALPSLVLLAWLRPPEAVARRAADVADPAPQPAPEPTPEPAPLPKQGA